MTSPFADTTFKRDQQSQKSTLNIYYIDRKGRTKGCFVAQWRYDHKFGRNTCDLAFPLSKAIIDIGGKQSVDRCMDLADTHQMLFT